MCRSLHSEMNAIISASREEMIGATLYMCCTDPKDGSVVGGVSSCMMCKRFIINAGITKVIIRENKFEYTEVDVADWIKNDDSLSGKFGY